ncbi:hypothetical protein AAG570_004939 [Ranatra chinensis]|uniref:Uncharacterized protein n=1 Tax=Ranatra chinensis TaxID=642074 RepID=A0ABD0XZ01_9HEMI
MASKRRNMFRKNKSQETSENVASILAIDHEGMVEDVSTDGGPYSRNCIRDHYIIGRATGGAVRPPGGTYRNKGAGGPPEAAKLDRSTVGKPSRVIHIRNIPNDVTEAEIIHLGIPFGRVTNVLVLKGKNQLLDAILSGERVPASPPTSVVSLVLSKLMTEVLQDIQ